MSYDLGDATKWEFVFPTMDKPLLTIPTVDDSALDLDEDEVVHFKLTYCTCLS